MATMLIPYALKNGNFVHVSAVDRGLACGCYCPLCGGALVKRVFESKQKIDHFAHHNSSCGYAPESILHLLGKHLICKSSFFTYPFGGTEKTIKIETARVEVKKGIYRIDVVLNEGLESELLVEVVVKNPVDKVKQSTLLKEGCIGIIVNIPIQAIQFDLERLTNCLINSCEWKREFSEVVEVQNENIFEEDLYEPTKTARKKAILIRAELIPYWSKYYNNIGLTRAKYKHFKNLFILDHKREPNQKEADLFILQLIETEKASKPIKISAEPNGEVSISEYIKASRGY